MKLLAVEPEHTVRPSRLCNLKPIPPRASAIDNAFFLDVGIYLLHLIRGHTLTDNFGRREGSIDVAKIFSAKHNDFI